MTLKSLTLKTEKIEFADGSFTVRGLSPSDIASLVEVHKEVATSIFDRYSGRDPKDLSLNDAGELGRMLITVSPAVVAHAIALAANEPDEYEKVLSLPLDVQVAAIEKIVILTFRMTGGAKNFVEIVLRVTKGVNGLKKSTPTLKLGSGDSEAK